MLRFESWISLPGKVEIFRSGGKEESVHSSVQVRGSTINNLRAGGGGGGGLSWISLPGKVEIFRSGAKEG